MTVDVGRYLNRLGLQHAPPLTIEGLADLQVRHLIAVPFENIDVYLRRPVTTDPFAAMRKIVDERRGGWCFEANSAFAELLRALGFEVLVLGAATLFEGPSDVVDHMMLEVQLDQPYLVDVGFGQHSPLAPLPLNERTHEQSHLTYELLPSPKGTTLASVHDGVPTALCRFKRVGHDYRDFDGASRRLQDDPTSFFRLRPFATRVLDQSGSRITWSNDEITVTAPGATDQVRPVPVSDRAAVLQNEFGITGVDVDGSA